MDSAARRAGPVALSALLDGVARQLAPADKAAPIQSAAPGDVLVYSGNCHESVPRGLFLDRRLTPLERNAWQVLRLQLSGDGVMAFPVYEQLRPCLASIPTGQASHETVARALTLLRLTRWLSLARRRRDPQTGRILGNLYVLHDEPLTPFEAMQIDSDYLGLLSQAITHAAKAVRIAGMQTLREIAEDPMLGDRALPTRLQALAQRMAERGWESYPQEGAIHDSEEGELALLRNGESPSSESEAGAKPAPEGFVRNPKKDSTVRSINKVRTVLPAVHHLRLSECFLRLKDAQQAGALMALRQVEESQRQAVLDEWAARCHGSAVRDPAGYLFGIIQKAIRGEFKVWASESAAPATPWPASADPPAAPEVAQAYLARIRSRLRGA